MILLGLVTGCLNDDDAVKTSMNDVSSRITGFSSDITGAGASFSINGSHMDEVDRVFIGNAVIAKKSFTTVSESGITFNVPLTVPLGENEVIVVYPGSDRAFSSIEVVPLPAISSFTPYSAATGETITLYGTNFEIVEGVKLGAVDAAIVSQSASMLKFTVPAGIATGKITLTSDAGNANSAADLIACTANPTTSDCADGLNLNDGFELGATDNFDNWSKYNGGTYMVQTTTASEIFRGSRALKVVRDGSLGTGEWRIQLASDLITTEAAASYTVYIWAKASVAGGSLRVSTNPDAKYTANQNVTTQWQRLAFTFSTAGGNAIATTDTRVVLDFNGNNTAVTTFFIDDVKLVKN